jgi:HlyD family secretion protein
MHQSAKKTRLIPEKRNYLRDLRRQPNESFGYRAFFIFLLTLMSWGCSSKESTRNGEKKPLEASQPKAERVFAQGLVMPSDGIIRLLATPGDVLADLRVAVGSEVQTGQILAVMQSESVIRARRDALMEQKNVAQSEHASSVRRAELQCEAARLQLRQVQANVSLLDDQRSLIVMGEDQLLIAQRVLDRLVAIASDSVTSQFVGAIEIDRQKIAVGQALMQLEEQKNLYRSSKLELESALHAAESELQACEEQLLSLQQLEPGKLFDLQIEALETEAVRSVMTAPTDGIILAIGIAPGGAATQLPLIEMAATRRLVCEAEVNVVDVSRVKIGHRAVMSSRALAEPLNGTVIEKGRLVGRPRLRSPDPLAAADYRTLSVIIEIDEAAIAKEWLQLQVDVIFEPPIDR